jgi:uncharacterized repeat protein (TIGR02543 family)
VKKLSLFLVGFLFIFALAACDNGTKTTDCPDGQVLNDKGVCEEVNYTVTFDADGGSDVDALTVMHGGTVTEPSDPEKIGYIFGGWVDAEGNQYSFDSTVTADLTLKATWTIDENGDLYKILQDIDFYEDTMFVSEYQIDTPWKVAFNNSRVKWHSESQYISDEGVILPLPSDVEETTGVFVGTFTLNDIEYVHEFEIPLTHQGPVVIANTRTVPFQNLTTEYTIPNGNVELLFEENGTVPYIKVEDFFDLLVGFIDPEVEITRTTTDGVLELSYQYYDEDEDETYDLIVTIDSVENTITTNDPAFYWAYVSTTETNYGRHIEYIQDHPGEYYEEGEDVVYDLDDYYMDIVTYEGEVVMPYYMTNQLFAGLSYFNVYYNTDGLYGIYSLPSSGEKAYNTIHTSTMNNSDIPADLLVHTFNMFAFNLNNLYGLQDIMEVEDYYSVLYDNANKLLNPDPEEFDYAVRDLLLLELDEAHTSYGYPSYFNKTTFAGPETNSLSYYGSRFTNWYYDGYVAVDDVNEATWGAGAGNSWAAVNKPDYWFLDSKTVMLTLNGFVTSDIEESLTYDQTVVEKVLELDDATNLLAPIAEGNQFWYYKNSTSTAKIMEILVKGVTPGYEDTYMAALEAHGLTKVSESTVGDYKENGYYTVTIGDDDYMVLVSYDSEFDLLYVGVSNSVPATFSTPWSVKAEVKDLVDGDSAVYMEMMLDQIFAEQPTTENIILDLSWNTGGNIGALYRVLGFITDEPFEVSRMDGDTGMTGSTSYVTITDGIPSYAQYNWALLTTPVTFSAANELTALFRTNDLGPIIGVQSGGGACSITPILLPNGTAFTMSSNNIGAYRTGSGTDEDPYVYHDTEFGIVPDYEIDTDDIFDVEILLDILEQDQQ